VLDLTEYSAFESTLNSTNVSYRILSVHACVEGVASHTHKIVQLHVVHFLIKRALGQTLLSAAKDMFCMHTAHRLSLQW